MQVSFESPLALLYESKKYNDYEFALVHLFEKSLKYLTFYEKQIHYRMMFMDNSTFELGHPFNLEKYKFWIQHFCKIQAQNLYYVIPDYMFDVEKSKQAILDFKDFVAQPNKPGEPSNPQVQKAHAVGVLVTPEKAVRKSDVQQYALFLAQHVEVIAVPNTKNRIKYLKWIRAVLPDIKIHALGIQFPQDAKDLAPLVDTLDTSNPVVHGMLKIKYTESGLEAKSPQKLAHLLYNTVNAYQKQCIMHNIKQFKSQF